jgi:4-aminobutyrate aminotransferase-like enzyme
MPTLSAQFAEDDKVIECKEGLIQRLKEHQSALTGIRPPDPELKQSYDEAIKEFGDLRGGELFYRYLGSGFGNGALVELADGSVKYDFISGIGVHHFGHGNIDVVKAVLDAALADLVMQGNLQQNTVAFDVVKLMLQAANSKGAEFSHCFLTSSGAMANENALKLLFHKKPHADRILAFEGCFAGRTLVMSQITDKASYREGLPHTIAVDYVPFYDWKKPDESLSRSLEQLEKIVKRYPGKHGCMIFELVQGEGGFYPGTRDFFRSIMEFLRNRNIPIMIDEIQTFSRTTEPFAFQHFGLDEFPAMVTVGKVTQVCATIFKKEYKPNAGLISQTFTSGSAALAAASVILKALMDRRFWGPDGHVARISSHFVSRLEEIGKRMPGAVSGPYGLGGMIAFTPLGGSLETVKAILMDLFEAGVIAFYAGSDPTRIRFLPPLGAVDVGDVDKVCDILADVLQKHAEDQWCVMNPCDFGPEQEK